VIGCAAFVLLASYSQAQTNFTGATDTSLLDAGNWDNGLPTNANPGSVSGFDTTSPGNQSMDGITYTFGGVGTLTTAAMRWNNNTITYEGSYNHTATAALVLGRDGDGAATVNWDSAGTMTTGVANLQIGRQSDGTFNQSVGNVVAGTLLLGGVDSQNGNGLYTLSGGNITVDVFTLNTTTTGSKIFDFTTTSTGMLIVLNGGADYTAILQGYIDSGNITVGGVAQTPGDYSAFDISFDGNATTLSLVSGPTLPAAFANAVALSGDWYWLENFGYFYFDGTSTFAYSFTFDSWIYVDPAGTTAGVWFWVENPPSLPSTWFWTEEAALPWVWSSATQWINLNNLP
jgi:hypothetical protein